MKVAWVIRPAAGGIKQHLDHLLTGLGSQYEICICGPEELREWAGGNPFYPISIVDGLDLTQDLKAIWQLSKTLRSIKPRLVHIHGLKSVQITVPAAALSRARKLLFTAHNCLPKPKSRLNRVAHEVAMRRLLRAVTRIIAVSDAVGYEFLQYVPVDRIVTIRNGVDHRRFSGSSRTEARREMGLDPDQFAIGAVARLIPEKGITDLLQAAALLKNIFPQARFLIAGDGPMRDSLKHYSRALGLGSYVQFLGYRHDVPALMVGWDLFVLPSWSEGLSVSVLEAMAAKLPLVVSDLPSMREVVVPGKSGFFFPPRDIPALAAAIIQIAKDPGKAKLMGDYNHQRVLRSFGIEQMIEATRMQYRLLIEEGAGL
ncbi:MAG: glycosyltransferase [Firmicutes bacterium]|nr:glycosyltransferase [Bacillota bacterium]